ncbi:hypothetical protein GGF41_004169, partial [Coemansia sp. RSA 2531]
MLIPSSPEERASIQHFPYHLVKKIAIRATELHAPKRGFDFYYAGSCVLEMTRGLMSLCQNWYGVCRPFLYEQVSIFMHEVAQANPPRHNNYMNVLDFDEQHSMVLAQQAYIVCSYEDIVCG